MHHHTQQQKSRSTPMNQNKIFAPLYTMVHVHRSPNPKACTVVLSMKYHVPRQP